MKCCVLTCRQVKSLDGSSGHAVKVLQHGECQTVEGAELQQQGGDRQTSVCPRQDDSTQTQAALPSVVQPPDPDAEAKRDKAVTALSAAGKQRAFDAWLDLRTRRQGLLAAAASLWTVGTLRGAWAHWQAEHQRTGFRLERADRHASVTAFRRAMQVRSSLECVKQRQSEQTCLDVLHHHHSQIPDE